MPATCDIQPRSAAPGDDRPRHRAAPRSSWPVAADHRAAAPCHRAAMWLYTAWVVCIGGVYAYYMLGERLAVYLHRWFGL